MPMMLLAARRCVDAGEVHVDLLQVWQMSGSQLCAH